MDLLEPVKIHIKEDRYTYQFERTPDITIESSFITGKISYHYDFAYMWLSLSNLPGHVFFGNVN